MRNSNKTIGILIIIISVVAYIYFYYFREDKNLPIISSNNIEIDNPNIEPEVTEDKKEYKTVKIYVTDSKGKLRSVSRKCDVEIEKSCFNYAIKELIKAPTNWEKSKGLSSEIPSDTKILSIRESSNNILIDLSSSFESGGGAESLYTRISQLIKTVQSNTKIPVYLYINGKQADVIGGEGIMIKQPLNERSLDE